MSEKLQAIRSLNAESAQDQALNWLLKLLSTAHITRGPASYGMHLLLELHHLKLTAFSFAHVRNCVIVHVLSLLQRNIYLLPLPLFYLILSFLSAISLSLSLSPSLSFSVCLSVCLPVCLSLPFLLPPLNY